MRDAMLLRSLDLPRYQKNLFQGGLTASARHALMYTSTGKTHTTDGYKQGKHDRPTDARKQVSEQRTAEASPPNLYKRIGGRHMAGRPKDGGQPLTSLSIRISSEMKAELEARARRQRRTTSDYVKLLLEKVLSEPEPERE